MSDSIVFYHGRDDVLHIIDPDGLPHFDEHPPIIDIVVAVINAGYAGVFVDEKKLSNGRFILGLSVNQGTPEGQVIQNLVSAADAGKQLPSIGFVLEQIKNQYAVSGGHHE
jgi:hypothetical protein